MLLWARCWPGHWDNSKQDKHGPCPYGTSCLTEKINMEQIMISLPLYWRRCARVLRKSVNRRAQLSMMSQELPRGGGCYTKTWKVSWSKLGTGGSSYRGPEMERKTGLFQETERNSIRREWLKKKLRRRAEARPPHERVVIWLELSRSPCQEATQDPEPLADLGFW